MFKKIASRATIFGILLLTSCFFLPSHTSADTIFSQELTGGTYNLGNDGAPVNYVGSFVAQATSTVYGFNMNGTVHQATPYLAVLSVNIAGGSGGSAGSTCIISTPNTFYNDNTYVNYVGTTTAPTQDRCTFNGGQTYSITIDYNYGGYANNYFASEASPLPVSIPAFEIYDSGGPTPPPVNTQTRFIEIEPYATTTASTTVNLNAGIYYNSVDPYAGYFNEICVDLYYMEGNFTQLTFTPYEPHLCMPITASGESGVSTTTTLLSGLWSAVWYFYDTDDGNKAYSTSTAFVVVSTQTPPEYFTQNPDGTYAFNVSSTSPMYVPRLESCNLTDFSFADCLSSIVGWQPLAMNSAFNVFLSQTLSYFPWGYITRTTAILNSPATTTLPMLEYTFADDFPVVDMRNVYIGFDFWGGVQTAWTLIDTEIQSTGDDPKSLWEIVETPLMYLVYLTLLFVMVGRILQIELVSNGTQHDDSDRLKDWLNKNKKR